MGRAPCCDKANVKKGPWSPEEDTKLKDYIDKYGTGGNWIALPQKAGLRRCGKSCRLRWLNYLRPNIKHGDFSVDEDRVICSLFASIGSRWSIIAAQLPGRTDNDIKNYWNTKLKKKILGIPPSQRKPHQQQQQLIFQPSLQATPPPSSSQSSCYYGLESIPFSPDALIPQGQVHQQSCSSSDGSLTHVSYGKEREFGMGFESYIYGGMQQTQEVMIDNGGGGGGSGEAPLEYSYEIFKQLVSPSNGCNSMYLDGPRAASADKEDISFKAQERGMYYYHYY